MPKTVAQKAPAAVKGASRKRKVNGYQMPERIPIGMILTDLSKQQWKIGPSIGVGGFGEIYCACKANDAPKKHDDYPFVVKVVSAFGANQYKSHTYTELVDFIFR